MDEINVNEFDNYTDVENDLSMKYLTFQVSGQHFGILIENVIEIVKVQTPTEMPELPYYVKGIINLRGRVIPLIDINLRFGKEEQPYTDRTCVIIVDIDDVYVGFIVDAVSEVLDIDSSIISPPPAFLDGGSARYVTGIGKLNEYMVLLLNYRLLLSDSDIMSMV